MMQAMRVELAELRAAQATAAPGNPPGAAALPGATTAPTGALWQPADAHQPMLRNLGETFVECQEEDFSDIDKKDAVPPSKCRGGAAAWHHWYTKLPVLPKFCEAALQS